MGIIAKNTGSNYEPAPEGTHVAVCSMMVDLGMQPTTYQGIEKMKHQVYLGFSLVNEPLQYERDGQTVNTFMSIGQTYTLSLNEKAKLRQHLESWRGKKFSSAEEAGFDIANVLGAPCMITVVHNINNGNTYANIGSISGLVKGMEKPNFEGELILYHAGKKDQADKLPNWLKRKLGLISDDGDKPAAPMASTALSQQGDPVFDDDIPF